MPAYTIYWPAHVCDRARAANLEGLGLPAVFGGGNADTNFARFKVGPEDVVFLLTVVEGELFVLASMRVEVKTEAEQWLKLHPEHSRFQVMGYAGQVLAGRPLAPLQFDRKVPPAVLKAWRFDSGKTGRALRFLERGRLKKVSSLQGVYRLQAETAAHLRDVLETDAARPRGEEGPLLMRLKERPDDADAARVLADHWAEKGDLRGEVLSLEVALAEPGLAPERAAALDERRTLLARKHTGLLKKPGGFPFRGMWGRRPWLRVFFGFRTIDEEAVPKTVRFLERFTTARGARQIDFGGFGFRAVMPPPRRALLEDLKGLKGTLEGGSWMAEGELAFDEVLRLSELEAWRGLPENYFSFSFRLTFPGTRWQLPGQEQLLRGGLQAPYSTLQLGLDGGYHLQLETGFQSRTAAFERWLAEVTDALPVLPEGPRVATCEVRGEVVSVR